MGFGILTRTFERLYLALLLVSAFDSTDCFLCFLRAMRSNHHPQLVLPCLKRKVQIVYQFKRAGMSNSAHQDSEPMDVEEEGNTCQDDYYSATKINDMILPTQRRLSGLRSEKTLVEDLDPGISYRLKIQTPSVMFICLTNVTFNETEMPTAIPRTTSDVEKTNQGLTLTGVGSSTVATLNTVITNMKTQGEGSEISASSLILGTTVSLQTSKIDRSTNHVGVTEQTSTTSSRSSSTGNQETALDQRQSNFPIWVIFVIIAIMIISIFAVVLGVFIRRRKQNDHQPANNVTTGRENGESNGMNGNIKNHKDVILNPTYVEEPVNEKEEEYHSYTEIDVKVPDNSEMIYNSAYESPPASTDMVYNCAYESDETNSDMIYNTAYESSPSK